MNTDIDSGNTLEHHETSFAFFRRPHGFHAWRLVGASIKLAASSPSTPEESGRYDMGHIALLTLFTGKTHASLSEHGLKTFGQAADKLLELSDNVR